MKSVGYVARMGEMRCAYRVLVGRPDGNRLLRKHRHRWESDVLQEIGQGR